MKEQLKPVEQQKPYSIEPPKNRIIKKFPDPETLEEFMRGITGGGSKVIFSTTEGEFKWIK